MAEESPYSRISPSSRSSCFLFVDSGRFFEIPANVAMNGVNGGSVSPLTALDRAAGAVLEGIIRARELLGSGLSDRVEAPCCGWHF